MAATKLLGNGAMREFRCRIICFLALAANTLGSPVQPNQSPNNNLEVNTPQTASGCYHQYDPCHIAVLKPRRVLTRC